MPGYAISFPMFCCPDLGGYNPEQTTQLLAGIAR